MRKKTLAWLLAVLMVGSLVISLPITASADGSAAGNAAVFDATSNSFIQVPDSDSLDATNALTVEAWIKPDNGGEWALIMGKQWNSADANPWYSYRLLAASANPSEQGFPRKVAFQIAPEGSGETGVESTTVVQNDVWTHVAGVYDGSSVKIYINGELEGSNPVTGSIRTSDLPLYLGKAPWTNFNNYNGMIDEVRVWNVARTAAQIDYDMRHTLTGDEPGLVGYWNFDEVSGNTAADATDNCNDGTLNNGAAFAASDTLLSLPDETEIIVANTDNHSIDFFHIAADGNAAPSRTIKGSSTNLNRPVDVALYDGKLYVLNHVAHAIEVFDPAATGDTAPVRRIIGGMSYPSGFDFDTTTQEIFVANYSGDITVYNASDSGIVTPKRTIAKYNAMTVAVSGNELFVTTYTEPAVYVYNKTTGNLLRTIQGANTGLSGNLYGVAISDGELFISDAVNNAIHVFNLTDSGDTEPKRTISGSNTLLGMPRELHIADNKLYIANKNNSVLIFGLMASGNVAPVQVLSGTETTFNAIQGVTVAESDTDDPPETPLLIQSTETRLVDFFPKTTQGENGIYLQRAHNGTYSNLDNFGDFTFKTTDTAWNLPIVILGDKAGNKDNEIIQAEPSTAENSAIRVTLNGDYGLVHVTGSAQMTKASGSARFFIYKGEYGYTEPLWQATLSGLNSDSFDLSIPYTEGEQLFFSIDANGPDTDDWAAWNQIRFIAASDSVSPVLTAGAVYRTSATEATVRFVSDTAGTYYYQVTNSSTSPTVDDLSGWTSGGSVSADTITAVSPVGLTTGAKYVHIVVEDAAENLSDTLTFSMPYDIYFFDAFETYPENTTASSGLLSFTQAHNGNGDSNQKVVAEGTNQVFSLSGQSNWASDQYIALPNNLTGIIVLEAKTKPVSGTDPAYLRLFNGSQDTATVLVRDGYWHSRAAGTNTSLGVAYTTDTWYAVKLAYDTAANTFDIWIDGVKANTAPITGSLSTNYNLYLTAGNGSATTACFDDVRLYVTSTLDSDTTAPVLTAGSVSRTTDTSATVKFTSDEAGEYYYQVVASGDSAPTIDTTGDGIPCDTEEQTISLTGLTAGAKDIYIVVKDAAGNVSNSNFKISIPAYVPAAHGSIQFESGSWSVPEDYSSHGYVERVGGSDGIITVDYYTVDDTAVAGTHYAAQSGTLTWADGDSAPKTIPCTIYNDSTYNGYLQFSYVLSNPTGGAVLGSQNPLLMQIRDNDNPPIPSGLTATAGNGKVTLNWNEVKDANYRVYFSTTSASYNEADNVDVYDETSTVITGLKNGTKYYFVVKAVHDIYLSPESNEVSATPTGGGGSYTPATYLITSSSTEGGTITPTGTTTISEYSSTTYTITPDAGYKITDVLVDSVSVGAVTTYTFTSVTANHTIEAKFAHDCPSKPFTDVDITQWYHEGIDYVLLEGLFKGTSATTFEPNAAMTRAMLVTVLHRLEGTPAATGNPFSDVASGNWYTDAVAWANAKGIVKGYDSDTFGTNDFVTREQLATILYRYAGYKGYDVSVGEDTNILSYEDAFNISEYAIPAIQWACGAGIMQGDGAKLDPQGNATRAQVAAMLMRFLENVVK